MRALDVAYFSDVEEKAEFKMIKYSEKNSHALVFVVRDQSCPQFFVNAI